MTDFVNKNNIESNNDVYKKTLYRIGGYAALLILILIPIQIAIYLIWPHPTTIRAWFELFESNWLLGLIGFDLLYMISNLLLIFLFLSLFFALYEKRKALSIIALTLGLVGIIIYFSSNTSFEMLNVSQQYFKATSNEQKTILLASGQTFYSIFKGTSYLVYYVLSGISVILFSSIMIRSTVFRKSTAYFLLTSGIMMIIPATAGTIGMTLALLSLIPWSVFCILVIRDFLFIAE